MMETLQVENENAQLLSYVRLVVDQLRELPYPAIVDDADLLEMLEDAVPQVLPEWQKEYGTIDGKSVTEGFIHSVAKSQLLGVRGVLFEKGYLQADSARKFRVTVRILEDASQSPTPLAVPPAEKPAAEPIAVDEADYLEAMSIKDCTQWFKKSESTINRWIREGKLRCKKKVNGMVQLHREDALALGWPK